MAGAQPRKRVARRSPFVEQVLAAVSAVSRGRVVTYGEIAVTIGRPRASRVVGTVLKGLPDGTLVPWHRVVSRDGSIPEAGRGHWAVIQRALLKRERVPFDAAGRVDFEALARRAKRPRQRS